MPRAESKQSKSSESKTANIKVSKTEEKPTKVATVKKQQTKGSKPNNDVVKETETKSQKKTTVKMASVDEKSTETTVAVKTVSENSEESKFNKHISDIEKELNNVKSVLRNLNIGLRILKSTHQQEMKKAEKAKPKRKGVRRLTGFMEEKPVPRKFAIFLGVVPGTKMRGPDITSAVWKKINERGLLEGDKRVFKVDKEISEVFKVPMSANKIKDHEDVKNGFNFRNLQKFIAKAMKE